jgi:hypothetical protein
MSDIPLIPSNRKFYGKSLGGRFVMETGWKIYPRRIYHRNWQLTYNV